MVHPRVHHVPWLKSAGLTDLKNLILKGFLSSTFKPAISEHRENTNIRSSDTDS